MIGAGKSAYDIGLEMTRSGIAEQATWIYKKALWGFNYDWMYPASPSRKAQFSGIFSKYMNYVHRLRRETESADMARDRNDLVQSGLILNLDDGSENIHQTRSAIYKQDELRLLRNEVIGEVLGPIWSRPRRRDAP
jgi:hypothetical protein